MSRNLGPPGGRDGAGEPPLARPPSKSYLAQHHRTHIVTARTDRVGRIRGGDRVCDKCEYVRLIDWRRTTCLCDVGAPHYVATVTVDRNGNETFWLARKDLLGRPDASRQ